MSEWILIFLLIVGILVILGLILTLVVFKKKKENKKVEPNYQVFFILGISWIPIGVVFMITVHPVIGMVFMAMGLGYMAIGLANRDKWQKK
jgi:hypothetical protein